MEDSNIDDVMNIVEIHGETIKMKILDNVSANKIFSSSNKGLKIAQGVILFYSVADRKSFNILKMRLSRTHNRPPPSFSIKLFILELFLKISIIYF